jgi:hypothetical protein
MPSISLCHESQYGMAFNYRMNRKPGEITCPLPPPATPPKEDRLSSSSIGNRFVKKCN